MCRVHCVPKTVPEQLWLWFTTYNAYTIKRVHSKQQNDFKETWCNLNFISCLLFLDPQLSQNLNNSDIFMKKNDLFYYQL